jgi:hypothetical protein
MSDHQNTNPKESSQTTYSNMGDLHTAAMELAEKAYCAREVGNAEEASRCLVQAKELAEKAVRLAVFNEVPELARLVVISSAIHLAVEAGDITLTKMLAAVGLANVVGGVKIARQFFNIPYECYASPEEIQHEQA